MPAITRIRLIAVSTRREKAGVGIGSSGKERQR